MNQLIPAWLALLFIAVFAFGIGFFLLRFNEKVTTEMSQSNSAYTNMMISQSIEMRKSKK